jgi:hypothetical protein
VTHLKGGAPWLIRHVSVVAVHLRASDFLLLGIDVLIRNSSAFPLSRTLGILATRASLNLSFSAAYIFFG